MKFGIWTSNASAQLLLLPCSCIAPGLLLACSQPAPGLLIVCSCPAPDPAHPSFAAFIIISTLRLFSARREPPFMVNIRGRRIVKKLVYRILRIPTNANTKYRIPNRRIANTEYRILVCIKYYVFFLNSALILKYAKYSMMIFLL